MNRLAKNLNLLLPAGLVAAGLFYATQTTFGTGALPTAIQSLAAAPAESDLVAPAPEEFSSILTTRDWQEVDTSGSKIKPRGSSVSGSSFAPPTPPAPQRAALASSSSNAGTDASVPFNLIPIANNTSATAQEVAFINALRDAINQSELSKYKTKSSKKAPRR